ncbi:hypothetical protein EOD29_00280 [Mesorhizobium sp. M1A.T.Ca.IN.004.03.1.1]|uniref:hypothetical protein n=1 Tax=Mesorhizobium sp. M1A.T.Ca.IN.004.03.1.1 TaxID=2496795 RepID=UPI000FCA84B5|nr:hypothetical protein [Mesorhizobium sp. M1A.T.Ca.IN.004.03.1.1]RUV45334.1 hypothetical protein EOD29_00280 [Mesorhizobium sp. M1A.T.Ca.IN.004.03.1.1]
MTEKRGRGRPVGSGMKDEPFLADIADLLIRTPGLKPTAAMRRVMKARNDWESASPEAMIRRLQAKWRVAGAAQLAAAHKRSAARTTPKSERTNHVGIPDAVAQLQRHMKAVSSLTSPLLAQASEKFRQFEEARTRAFGPGQRFLDEIAAANKQAQLQLDSIKRHYGSLAALEKMMAEQAAAVRNLGFI